MSCWVINNKGSHVGQIKTPREFHLDEFSNHTLRAFSSMVTECINQNQAILPIFVESDGGRVDIMKGIMSIMDYARKTIGMKFATVVNSRAQSAGAMIFLYGDEGFRFMGENAFLMLHAASLGAIGKIGEVKRTVDHHHNDWNFISNKVGKHLKKPKDWMQKQLSKIQNDDWIMTAQEAQEERLCLAHSPTFVITVEESISVS